MGGRGIQGDLDQGQLFCVTWEKNHPAVAPHPRTGLRASRFERLL